VKGNRYTFSDAVAISSLVVGAMILVAVLNRVLPFDLRTFGIVPRRAWGLVGVVFCPLLHLGFAYLFANALPLFVLLVLLFAERRYRPGETLAWIWFGSGLGTWLIGRGNAVHIGASSLIYGLVVYLIAAGWWLRSWSSISVALLVLLFYGGIFYGMLPQPGIVSWEDHLAGAITGFLVARHSHA